MGLNTAAITGETEAYVTKVTPAGSVTDNTDLDADHDGFPDLCATRPDLSGPARFLQRLQKLVDTQPIEGAKALKALADHVRARAAEGPDADKTKAFVMAAKLDLAADTGNLQALAAPAAAAPSKVAQSYAPTTTDALTELAVAGDAILSRMIPNTPTR